MVEVGCVETFWGVADLELLAIHELSSVQLVANIHDNIRLRMEMNDVVISWVRCVLLLLQRWKRCARCFVQIGFCWILQTGLTMCMLSTLIDGIVSLGFISVLYYDAFDFKHMQ